MSCTALLLCDDCDSTLLVEYPIRETATPAPITDVTTDAAALAVNQISRISGAVTTVQVPATAAEKDTFTAFNNSLHDITLQASGGTSDLAVIDAGSIVTYIYDGGAWVVY